MLLLRQVAEHFGLPEGIALDRAFVTTAAAVAGRGETDEERAGADVVGVQADADEESNVREGNRVYDEAADQAAEAEQERLAEEKQMEQKQKAVDRRAAKAAEADRKRKVEEEVRAQAARSAKKHQAARTNRAKEQENRKRVREEACTQVPREETVGPTLPAAVQVMGITDEEAAVQERFWLSKEVRTSTPVRSTCNGLTVRVIVCQYA